jgi:hypothetical protein
VGIDGDAVEPCTGVVGRSSRGTTSRSVRGVVMGSACRWQFY